MSALSPILRAVTDGAGRKLLSFWCPGCDSAHTIYIARAERPCWGWNGSADAPTFTPSILVTQGHYVGAKSAADCTYCNWSDEEKAEWGFGCGVCHSFVTDGQIQFLGDCTHTLAGQTVPILPWPSDYHDGDQSE